MVGTRRLLIGGILCVASMPIAENAQGQMIQQDVTLNNAQFGYAESFGTDWAIRSRNFFFGFGGAGMGGGPLLPPFGPQAPASRIGFGGPNGHFSLFGGQASSSSITSTSASVTSLDGMPASIQDQRLVPFVTGFTPVVGSNGYGPIDSDAAARNETLRRISESVAASHSARLQRYLRRAELGVQSGSLRMALSNYRRAMEMAPAELHPEILARIESLSH